MKTTTGGHRRQRRRQWSPGLVPTIRREVAAGGTTDVNMGGGGGGGGAAAATPPRRLVPAKVLHQLFSWSLIDFFCRLANKLFIVQQMAFAIVFAVIVAYYHRPHPPRQCDK